MTSGRNINTPNTLVKKLIDVQVIRKASDETVNNSNVLQNDNDLLFSIGANEVWLVIVHLFYNSPAAADFRYAWSVPAGCAVNRFYTWAANNPAAPTDGTASQSVLTSAANESNNILDVIANGATAGTAQFQWSQLVATVGDTKMLANSFIIAFRLN